MSNTKNAFISIVTILQRLEEENRITSEEYNDLLIRLNIVASAVPVE